MKWYLIVKVYAYNHDFLPSKTNWNKQVSEDKIIALGGILFFVGIVLSIIAVANWKYQNLGDLNPEASMRIVIPAVLCLIVGAQSLCTGFVIGVMKNQEKKGT